MEGKFKNLDNESLEKKLKELQNENDIQIYLEELKGKVRNLTDALIIHCNR